MTKMKVLSHCNVKSYKTYTGHLYIHVFVNTLLGMNELKTVIIVVPEVHTENLKENKQNIQH